MACNGALAAPTAPSVQREDFFAAFAQQPFQQVRNRFLSVVQHQSGGMAGKLRSLFSRDKKEKKA